VIEKLGEAQNQIMNKPLKKLENARGEASDSDLGTRRFGYAVIAALLLGIGGWSAFAPLEIAALAVGVVQVDGKRKAIQHLEGGIVAEILVSNGDLVEAGQPLLRLDAAEHRAEQEIVRGRVFNTQATIDRLIAERDDQTRLSFSDQLNEAGSTDMRARNAIKNEEALFMARLSDREGEEAVLNSQRKGWSEILQSKEIIAESLTEEIADLNELLVDGFVDKQRVRELERMRSQVMGEIADLRVSIDEVALKIAQMRKRFKTEVVDELTQTDEELHDLEQQFTASEDTVLRATIRAPVSGIVLNLKPNTVGAVIQSGETLMEIVPQTSKLIVDARISPMDIDRVSVGQDAEVRFSVFKDAYMVSGFLKKLSADRLVDEGSDTPYYSAEIDLHEEDLNLLEGMALVPGMPAEVLIKTGERTLLAYLVSPMNRIFSRALIEE